MANANIITRGGKGAALSASDNDQNLKSLSRIVELQTVTTYTVTVADQNKLIELDNAAMIVSLPSVSSILVLAKTPSFTVLLRNRNATHAKIQAVDNIQGNPYIYLSFKDCIELSTSSSGWIIASGNPVGLTISTSGSTTGKTMILTSAHTDDRSLALPDETGTLSTRSYAENFATAADTALGSSLTTTLTASIDAVKRMVDVGTISLGTTQSIAVTGDPDRLEVSIYAATQSTGVDIFLRIGTGAALHVSGYKAAAGDDGGSNVATAGFPLKSSSATVGAISGNLTLQRIKAIGGGLDAWNVSGVVYMDTAVTDSATFISGRLTFSGALDIIGIGVASGSVTGGFMRVWAEVTG